MIALTAILSAIAILTALLVHPTRGLGLVIAGMMIYPEYMRVPMGLAQMSLPRFVALALLIRGLCGARRRLFRWHWIDALILIQWAWNVSAAALAGADQTRMVESIGNVLDTALMYFTARLCLLEVNEYRKLLAPLAICAIVVGILGAVETLAFWSPYESLRIYTPLQMYSKPSEYRMGMLRALGSTSVAIYFGMSMFLILAILYALREFFRNKLFWFIACLAAMIGAISSLSSGPQSALAVFFFASLFYRRTNLIKPLLSCIAVLLLAMEVLSSRHIWHLMEYANIFGGDYWYRGRLIEVAVQQWRDYWIIGVGSSYPQHWGMMIDGRKFVDLVNHYIIVALNAGLPGLFLFVGILVLALRLCVRNWHATADPRTRRLVFHQGAAIVALMFSIASIGLFGPPLLLTYILLGMIARFGGTHSPDRILWPVFVVKSHWRTSHETLDCHHLLE